MNGPNKPSRPDPRRTALPLISYAVLLAVLVFALSRGFEYPPERETVDYSRFKALVEEGAISRVVIAPHELRGIAAAQPAAEGAKDGADATAAQRQVVYVTPRVDDPELVPLLEKRGVAYTGAAEGPALGSILQWVFTLVAFGFLWFWLLRSRAGPGTALSFGRSRAKLIATEDVGVSFADVAGVDEAKEELEEVVEFLREPQRFAQIGARIPKGVLLVGPPGTGKTLLARAIAGEAGVPFYSLTGSDFVEMFVGVGAARVRDMFAQAESRAPCIIFIDELDAVGKARGSSIVANEEREQTLNQLLAEMDGFDARKGVIIIAATNRPETIDPALLRAGRFDRQILVDRPDINGREAILKVHARRLQLAPGVDLRAVAAATPGFAGADLANVLNEAALLAVRRRKAAVEAVDLQDAIERIVAGLEKKSRVMSPEEKKRVAHHEAGHALVAARLTPGTPVRKISIIPRGIGALGYTLQVPLEDRYLMTREELCDKLAVLLGGRTAEEICFGTISTGASDDLQRVTDIASRMVREYGMSERMGPLSFEQPGMPMLPSLHTLGRGTSYSDRTAETIDAEVSALVEEAHDRARAILERERPQLDRLAAALLEREMLEGAELARLLAAPPVPLRVVPASRGSGNGQDE
jgi:cell division protease FtsH